MPERYYEILKKKKKVQRVSSRDSGEGEGGGLLSFTCRLDSYCMSLKLNICNLQHLY